MDYLSHPMIFIALPLVAGVTALLFILVLTPIAERVRLLDMPDHRKRHGVPVPMVGGLAIYLVMISAVLVLEPPVTLSWLIFSGTLLVVAGVLDDAVGLSVRTRFSVQILSTGLMLMGSGFWIQSLGIGFLGLDSLPAWIGMCITLFAIVGLTNGFNMVDGIDGLASGHMLLGLLSVLSSLVWTIGWDSRLIWLAILISSVFAFWLVNLSLIPLRKVFLGDAGSLLLGFVMGWTLVFYTQEPVALLNPVVALWCVTLPVFDTLTVIVRRLQQGRSPFSPDRNHLHHILVDSGISSGKTLAIILAASAVVNAGGIWLVYAVSPVISLAAYLILLCVFVYGVLHPEIERRLALKFRLAD